MINMDHFIDNSIITNHINNHIKIIMEEPILNCFSPDIDYPHNINKLNSLFIQSVKKYFPPNYPYVLMGRDYLDCFAVVSDQAAHELTLIEKYILYHVIQTNSEVIKKNPFSQTDRVKLEHLADDDPDLICYVDEAENVRSYKKFCFENLDFLFLKNQTLDGLINSPISYEFSINIDAKHDGPAWEDYQSEYTEILNE